MTQNHSEVTVLTKLEKNLHEGGLLGTDFRLDAEIFVLSRAPNLSDDPDKQADDAEGCLLLQASWESLKEGDSLALSIILSEL
ncbi:hypothetical protein SUGI_0352390 [Cryptomeria japonica]|nr:hypothetical protein SUGI_0352390 [Cryptomeria japonica]